ncbi:hypothetical protein A0H81_11224 [Grifola frondosa]|uniref:Uncharacterized protein n=1 Tax=Grifola frondosa TaxID=5627 RepID=A0A1C7LW02_GRIFR|nr:hypothetical protein A0H81_11224 [Grifola frondosa]
MGRPRLNGGRMLDYTSKNWPDTYVKSIGFSEECLGLHYGKIHEADLGDGDGRKPEHFLGRQHYFPIMGTCWESVRGGQHFRAWRQNGTDANTGAWFIGASEEKDSSRNHMIVENGYNRGRDFIVERATQPSRWKGDWWQADVEWREGLLEKGKRRVNHGIAQRACCDSHYQSALILSRGSMDFRSFIHSLCFFLLVYAVTIRMIYISYAP